MQGPKDIYLGMTGAIIGTIPTAFLYFSTYEWCKEKLAARGHSQVLGKLLPLFHIPGTLGLTELDHFVDAKPQQASHIAAVARHMMKRMEAITHLPFPKRQCHPGCLAAHETCNWTPYCTMLPLQKQQTDMRGELCRREAEVCVACMQAVTHLASASAGAILSAFVRVPTDTLKHRTQAYLIPDVWRVRPSSA